MESGERAWQRKVRAKRRHWTKLQVRRHLRQLHSRLGRWPALREYRSLCHKDGTLPPVDEIVRIYGSWRAARLDAASTQSVPHLGALYRKYEGGASLHELASDVGVSVMTVRKAFREAGLRVRTSDESLAMRAQRADGRMERETVSIFQKTGNLAATAAQLGMNSARTRRILVQADVNVEAYVAWCVHRAEPKGLLTAEKARILLQRAAKRTNGRLSAKRYVELAKDKAQSSKRPWPLSPDTLIRALGVATWNQALAAAGVPKGPSSGTRGFDRNMVWPRIKQLSEDLGRAPTMTEYDALRRDGLVSSQALTKRFGGWRDVLDVAGVERPT
jgi:hypothetical protein